MARPRLDLSGKKFGRITLVEAVETNEAGQVIWNCKCDCGTEFKAVGSPISKGRRKSCGCLRVEQLSANRPRKHGFGWTVDNDGYCKLYIPPAQRDGTTSTRADGTIAEHRYVMEKHIGRKLVHPETVHHKNGDKMDNALSNLELRTGNHGSGQGIPDLLKWARWLIDTYGPIENLLTPTVPAGIP